MQQTEAKKAKEDCPKIGIYLLPLFLLIEFIFLFIQNPQNDLFLIKEIVLVYVVAYFIASLLSYSALCELMGISPRKTISNLIVFVFLSVLLSLPWGYGISWLLLMRLLKIKFTVGDAAIFMGISFAVGYFMWWGEYYSDYAREQPVANKQSNNLGQQSNDSAASPPVRPPSCVGYFVLPKDPNAYDRVIGLREPKARMWEAVQMMLGTEEGKRMQEYGLKPPKGILLYGPPGTGKTSFARATAQLFGIPFLVINASAIIGTHVGATENNIRSAFAFARSVAPCVMFWDEIDAVGKARTGNDINSPSQLALNPMLAEIDGFNPLRGVIVIGATNRKDILDDALLRPGRLDLHIEVGLPDVKARFQILKLYLGNRPQNITEDELWQVAVKLEGRSPADIEALVNEAARRAYFERAPIEARHLMPVRVERRLRE